MNTFWRLMKTIEHQYWSVLLFELCFRRLVIEFPGAAFDLAENPIRGRRLRRRRLRIEAELPRNKKKPNNNAKKDNSK